MQSLPAHQPLHRASGHADAFPVELAPDLVGTVDPDVVLPDPLNMADQHLVTRFTPAAKGRVLLPGGMSPVHRRGNLQDPADRLDLETLPVLVNERLHDFLWRPSSAWAEKAPARHRISLTRLSSRFSRSSSLMRRASAVLTPSRCPVSRSCCASSCTASVSCSRSWGQWPGLPPTASCTRGAPRAPCAWHARGPRGRTSLTSSSWLHLLKDWSLLQTRGGSERLVSASSSIMVAGTVTVADPNGHVVPFGHASV